MRYRALDLVTVLAADALGVADGPCHPRLHDRHHAGGQRAGLVGANRRRAPHRLARARRLDHVLVRHHLAHAESQGDGDSEGKALWNGDDKDGDASDEEANPLRVVHGIVPLLLAALCLGKEDAKTDEEDDDDASSKESSNLGDEDGHGIELDLQDRPSRPLILLLIVTLITKQDLLIGVGSDRNHQHLSLSILHFSSLEDKWRLVGSGLVGSHSLLRSGARNIHLLKVKVCGNVKVALLLELKLALGDGVALASQRPLENLEGVALKDEAIGDDNVASGEDEDVSNDNIPVGHLSLLASPNDIDQVIRRLVCKSTKLLLLAALLDGSDKHDNNHRYHDGESIKPAEALDGLKGGTDDDGNDGCDGEEDEGGVLESVPAKLPEGREGLLLDIVAAEDLLPVRDLVGVDALMDVCLELVAQALV
mmetsp:Transcript_24048/g.60401  ORF Transcript_24048/g.60401 Transcript_24048/m.60401 type:complete len:423 (-) Transcript_24048:222-1490(-)